MKIEEIEFLEQVASCLNLTYKLLDNHSDKLPWGVPTVDLRFLQSLSLEYRDKIRSYMAPHRYALLQNKKES